MLLQKSLEEKEKARGLMLFGARKGYRGDRTAKGY